MVSALSLRDRLFTGKDEIVSPSLSESAASAAAYVRRVGSAAFTVATAEGRIEACGDPSARLPVQSTRKVVASTVIGLLVADGEVDLDATLAALDIDDRVPPTLTPEERTATVRQVLQSRSGIYHPAAFEDPAMRNRPARGSAPPGERWHYNNWDFNVLATVVGRTGHDFFDVLFSRVAPALGWSSVREDDCQYVLEPVSQHPAYHLALTADELEALGVAYLTGSGPVTREWVEESWHPWTPDTGTGFGFGYCWWLGDPARLGGLRSFLAMGGRGHAVIVVPERNLVLAHRVVPRSPVSWDDVWPALSLAVGTADLDDVLGARAERLTDLAVLRGLVAVGDVRNLELTGDGVVEIIGTGPAGGARAAIVRPGGPGKLEAALPGGLPEGRMLRLRGDVTSTRGTARLFIGEAEGLDSATAPITRNPMMIGVRWGEAEAEVSVAELTIDFN